MTAAVAGGGSGGRIQLDHLEREGTPAADLYLSLNVKLVSERKSGESGNERMVANPHNYCLLTSTPPKEGLVNDQRGKV